MKKGLLLVNLGSPKSHDPKDVKAYLNEFLMDEYVIDLPFVLRAFIVRGIILNTRPEKSAHAYQRIWWKDGSPLVVLTERLRDKVRQYTSMPVEMAMRYGQPSIQSGLQKLYDRNVAEVLLLPLYPQYAMATTKTIVVLAEALMRKHFPGMGLKVLPSFYNHERYIQILTKSVKEYLPEDYDSLLFSFHGVPKRHIRKTDITKGHCKMNGACCKTPSEAHQYCYNHQCYETARVVAERLGIPEGRYKVSFQSRLGVDPWLQPYSDQTIAELPSKGVGNLSVVMPSFVSDCLETLEEIGIEAKHSFLKNGGKKFRMIPCLNDRSDWAQWIAEWAGEYAE